MLAKAILGAVLLGFPQVIFTNPIPTMDNASFQTTPQTNIILCLSNPASVDKSVANSTVYRFCTDHGGVNLAQGSNYSTGYDATADKRIVFNVINQCQPNGLYLPFEACVGGFGIVADCEAHCEAGGTSGGQAVESCIGFELSVVATEGGDGE